MSPGSLAFFEPPYEQLEKNQFGVPVLKSMYAWAKRMCPHATTYTYVNGDILLHKNFVKTLDAVVDHFRNNERFMVVGRRTNVDWAHNISLADYSDFQSPQSRPFIKNNTNTTISLKSLTTMASSQTKFDYKGHFRRGKVFEAYAEDYFTVSNNFDWSAIPPFVIGRPGYDNWLVDHGYHSHPNIHVVDASSSILAIHMTDSDGNQAWGGKKLDSKNVYYNYKFAKNQFDHGTTWHAHYCSVPLINKTTKRNVGVKLLKRNLPVGHPNIKFCGPQTVE
jgi:hypothetical protein